MHYLVSPLVRERVNVKISNISGVNIMWIAAGVNEREIPPPRLPRHPQNHMCLAKTAGGKTKNRAMYKRGQIVEI